MAKIKKLLSVALIFSLVLGLNIGTALTVNADSCGGFAEKDVYTPDEEEVIKDPVLHWAVRSALNQIEDRPVLTEDVVGKITGVSFEACAHPEEFEGWSQPFWIEDLDGLQYAKKLTMVDICYVASASHRIRSLEPIANLPELRTLWLKQDGITNISMLSNLTKMDHLELSSNEINDISAVAGMSKLTHLIVEHNSLTEVDAIENLGNLEYLNIANNNISNLPDMGQLTKLTYLDASGNDLSNADVVQIGKCVNLKEINLNNNSGITDIRPLAGLINLDSNSITLPVSQEVKADLMAAIAVNKLIDQFNISKMTEGDVEYVEEALAAYDALTAEQKTYFSDDRINAIRANLALVQNGQEPHYYEEYDEGGGARPVLDRVTVRAVDNRGVPMEGISFIKEGAGKKAYTTNAKGIVTIPHASWDMAWDLSVYLDPAETRYVAKPDKYEYEVNGEGQTYIIDGEWATGFEELVFVLTPVDEYVDKSALEEALADAEGVLDSFRYTESSYETFESALKNAKEINESADATQKQVDDAAADLSAAIGSLVRNKKLTAVKITVVDEDGNPFARPFQVQVKSSDESIVKSYNDFTKPETGAVIFPAKDNWPDGFTMSFRCCWREPYQLSCDSVPFTVGVENGKAYFKTVDGKAVDSDYELTVTAVPDLSNARAIRVAMSTHLRDLISKAESYDETKYTAKSYAALVSAVDEAKEVADEIDVEKANYDASVEIALQAECNKAAADIKAAESKLAKKANTVALTKLVAMNYSESLYTKSSYEVFKAALADAKSVLDDEDASQAEVDTAADALKAAQAGLVMLANKTELKSQLDRARAIDTSEYESGIEELNDAVAEAQRAYDDSDATQAEVDAAVASIKNAISGLKKPQAPVDYECLEGLFKAMVLDESGKPVSGVKFAAVVDGKTIETYTSDADGVVRISVDGSNRNKTTVIKVADSKYTSEDEHSFIITGISQWICSISTVDGQPYEQGKFYLTYTVKEAQGGSDNPDKPGVDPDNPGTDPENPEVTEADKSNLKEQIDIAESLSSRKKDYTEESWTSMQTALNSAKNVYSNADAAQDEVNAACAELESARNNLVKVEKPVVSEGSNIRILIVDENGAKITSDVPYTMTMFSPIRGTARNGVIEYDLSDGDSGVPEIKFALDNDTIEIDGVKYTADVTEHIFALNSSSLGVTIDKIDGEKLEGSRAVKFVFTREKSEEPGDNPGTDPDKPGVDPDKPGADPDKPGVDPDKPGTDPEQPVVTPAKPAAPTVQATKIKSLKRGKKSFKVTVAKCSSSKATGYQVRYSLKKNMSKAKTKTIGKKYSATTKTIKKLKAKKKYYVQVRTYRKVNGKTYYSKWSSKKSIKTK